MTLGWIDYSLDIVFAWVNTLQISQPYYMFQWCFIVLADRRFRFSGGSLKKVYYILTIHQ